MKKIFIYSCLLAVLFLFMPFTSSVNAEIDRNYPVYDISGVAITKEATPVYFYADTAKTIATLQAGTQLIVTGKSNGYYQIDYAGSKAYVNPKFTERYQTLEAYSLLGITTAATPVYLIGDTSKVIGTLSKSQKVTVIGKANGYYQITYGDKTAFVNPKTITKYYPVEILNLNGETLSKVTVYQFADTSTVLKTLDASTKVKISGKSNGYYEIVLGDSVGYIDPKHVGLIYPLTEMNQIGIAVKDMTVYAYADTRQTRGSLVANQEITITGKSNGYYRIKYGSSHGFVDSKLIGLKYALTEMNEIGIAAKDMVVYTFADTSHQRGSLVANQEITITGKSNGYYRIKYGSSHGFVDSKLINIKSAVTEMNQIGIAIKDMVVYTYANTSSQRGSLVANQEITITGKSNGYYRIKYGSSHGFVDAKLIGLKYALTEMSQIGVAIKDMVVYTFADTQHQRGSLVANQEITITGKSNGYYRIKYGSSHGFVDAKLIGLKYALTEMNQIGEAIKDMVVYTFADTSHQRGSLVAKQKITVTGKSNGYYRIKYGSSHGFVDAKLIGLIYNETSKKFTGITSKTVNMYSFADTSHYVRALKKSQTVKVIGLSNGYYKVTVGNQTGYVDAKAIGTYTPVKKYSATGTVKSKASLFVDTAGKTVSTKIAKGKTVTITGTVNNYYEVKINKKTYYIAKSSVDVHPKFVENPKKEYAVQIKLFNVYSAPSKSASYTKGRIINLSNIPLISTDNKWIAVEDPDTKEMYYINKSDITLKTYKGKSKDEVCKTKTKCEEYLTNYQTDAYKLIMQIWIIEALTKKTFDKLSEKALLTALNKVDQTSSLKLTGKLLFGDFSKVVKKIFKYKGYAENIYGAISDRDKYVEGFYAYASIPLYTSLIKNDKGKGTIISGPKGMYYSVKSQN